MTFSEMVAELKALGHDYVAEGRLEDWVQRSYQTLSARYQWPWLEASKEGTAPLEIKDLAYVLSVVNVTSERPIYGRTRQWLVERFPNLEETGEPLWWYLDNRTLRVLPTSTTEKVSARYVKKAPKLALAEEPLLPDEWHYLIVDEARTYALRDNDEFQVARELQEDVATRAQALIADQLQRDWQRPQSLVRVGSPFDYL